MFGMGLNRPSLTLTSGVDVFAHVCGQKADTSSNYCDNIQLYGKRRSCFVKCDTIFRLFLKISNYHKVGNLPYKFGHARPLGSRIIRYVGAYATDGQMGGQKPRLPSPSLRAGR